MSQILKFMGEHDDFLELKVIGYAHPDSLDYWDGNWITVLGTLQMGVFHADVSGDIRVEEFVEFHKELLTLYDTLQGEVTFKTLERWLEITIEVNKTGQISMSGFVKNGVFGVNRLNFEMDTDQTFLTEPINRLEQILEMYPIKGKRE